MVIPNFLIRLREVSSAKQGTKASTAGRSLWRRPHRQRAY